MNPISTQKSPSPEELHDLCSRLDAFILKTTAQRTASAAALSLGVEIEEIAI